MRHLAVALLLALAGCQPEPPDTLYVDPAFTAAQRAAIDDAIDQWCDAAGWCPTIVEYAAEGSIIGDPDYARRGRSVGSAGFNDGGTIVLNTQRDLTLEEFHELALHELGHYGTDGHVPGDGGRALMSWANCVVGPDMRCVPGTARVWSCIDATSAAKWCRDQGQRGCRSTCPEGYDPAAAAEEP